MARQCPTAVAHINGVAGNCYIWYKLFCVARIWVPIARHRMLSAILCPDQHHNCHDNCKACQKVMLVRIFELHLHGSALYYNVFRYFFLALGFPVVISFTGQLLFHWLLACFRFSYIGLTSIPILVHILCDGVQFSC